MNEILFIFIGILLPFVGTSIGALPTLFIKKMNDGLKSVLFGFSAGVMLAASVWSLLIPSIEAVGKGNGIIQSVVGYFSGIALMLVIDFVTEKRNGSQGGVEKMVFAVTVHNLPEGMAVGIALCGALNGGASYASALILALGVAIQNVPEGAIVSLPLYQSGTSKIKALFLGVLSGAVEIIGAVFALAATAFISALLPASLAFAAGSMHWVTFKELFSRASTRFGALFASLGFAVMMLLDVIFG